MFLNLFRDRFSPLKHAIGVDLGTSALKAVILESRLNAMPKLIGAYTVSYLDGNRTSEMRSRRQDSPAQALKVLIEKVFPCLPATKKVFAFSLPTQDVLLRSFCWEGGSNNMFEKTIKSKIAEWMLGVAEELIVDFDILKLSSPESVASNKVNVFVAISKKESIQRIIDTCRIAGAIPDIIELQSSALIHTISYCRKDSGQQPSILLDIGVSGCKILVIRGNEPISTAFIEFDSDILPQGISGAINDPVCQPFQVFELQSNTYDMSKYLASESVEIILGELRPRLKGLIGDLQGNEACEVLITGGLSSYDTFVTGVSSILGKSVLRLDPFRAVRGADDPYAKVDTLGGGSYAVSIGLAIRAHQSLVSRGLLGQIKRG